MMICTKYITDLLVNDFRIFVDKNTVIDYPRDLDEFDGNNNNFIKNSFKCIRYSDVYFDYIVLNIRGIYNVYVGKVEMLHIMSSKDDCRLIGVYNEDNLVNIHKRINYIIDKGLIYDDTFPDIIKSNNDIKYGLTMKIRKITYVNEDGNSIVANDLSKIIIPKDCKIKHLDKGIKLGPNFECFSIANNIQLIIDPNAKSLSNLCVMQTREGKNVIVSTYNKKNTIIGEYNDYIDILRDMKQLIN